MMTLEQVREHIETLTGASLDGTMPENMEDIIGAFRDDYEEYYSQEKPTENDDTYKQKYEDLRDKYIKRFSGIEIKDETMNLPEPASDEPEDKLANITVADLFEGRK